MFYLKNKKISKEIFFLALPIIVGNISRVLMSLVDMAMVGRLGSNEIAAVGMGAMLVWTITTFSIGIRTATQTISSRRLGQNKIDQSATAMHNGLIMAFLYSLPMSFAGYFFGEAIVSFFLADKLRTLCSTYTSTASLSVLFVSIGFVFQGFYNGIEKTKINMSVTVCSNLLNIYLNAGLIYGTEQIHLFFSNVFGFNLELFAYLWGKDLFPKMGIHGAAVATVLASAWMALHYFLYLFNYKIRKKIKVFRFVLDYKMIKKQIMLALPMGFQEVLITGGWSVFYKIVGMIGVLELAATEIVFQIMNASIMPAIGIGQSCATLVGKYMGKNRIDLAEKSIKEGILWSEIFMGTIGLLFIFFSPQIVSVFTKNQTLIELSTVGLRIVGFLQFIDAIGLTLWFALAGAGNTTFPAFVETVLLWVVVLPISYIIGIKHQVGIWAVWSGIIIHITFFAGIVSWKTMKGEWKDIVV